MIGSVTIAQCGIGRELLIHEAYPVHITDGKAWNFDIQKGPQPWERDAHFHLEVDKHSGLFYVARYQYPQGYLVTRPLLDRAGMYTGFDHQSMRVGLTKDGINLGIKRSGAAIGSNPRDEEWYFYIYDRYDNFAFWFWVVYKDDVDMGAYYMVTYDENGNREEARLGVELP